jgi:triosephosphate isomerase
MSIFENEKFIVANFKQSGNMNSMKEWLVEFKKQINEIGELKINIVLCPSFQFLDLFNRELGLENKNPKIFIGSQNLSSFSNLENTGEVGSENLKDLVKLLVKQNETILEKKESKPWKLPWKGRVSKAKIKNKVLNFSDK